jgi:phosphate starvation-inducible PhoH-like protein
MKRAERKRLKLGEGLDTAMLFGQQDRHLRLIEEAFGVQISARGEDIHLDGEPSAVHRAERLIEDLASLVAQGYPLHTREVQDAIRSFREDPASTPAMFSNAILLPAKKRWIVPKSVNQRAYLEAIQKNDIVIGIGPAGTGKTYLGMAMAISTLLKRETSRIILARPAVEAGERLGFLPGDMYAKVNPYLRPLYDALYDMMEMERANRLIERGEIEIAPLAYMRGRTLNDSFIILDEAQNSTSEQMKMFVTRLGFNSKIVVTGDITQVDLPSERTSGLIEIQQILSGIPGIQFVYFTEKDVVRHRLVSEIIKAYDRHEGQSKDRPKS